MRHMTTITDLDVSCSLSEVRWACWQPLVSSGMGGDPEGQLHFTLKYIRGVIVSQIVNDVVLDEGTH